MEILVETTGPNMENTMKLGGGCPRHIALSHFHLRMFRFVRDLCGYPAQKQPKRAKSRLSIVLIFLEVIGLACCLWWPAQDS
jgi:hypothetical protein